MLYQLPPGWTIDVDRFETFLRGGHPPRDAARLRDQLRVRLQAA
ncbi:MAG: hypothetical protein ACRD3G_27110 [Vicinamibacterales bacterium]